MTAGNSRAQHQHAVNTRCDLPLDMSEKISNTMSEKEKKKKGLYCKLTQIYGHMIQ